MAKEKRDEVRSREGYHKILRSCEQAVEHGLDWLWVDTCCIDKRSSSELSEAINSMYRWYGNSTRCYVYLKDVDKPTFPRDQDSTKYVNSGGWPEWFSRGWTLQELIAARDVQFFNKRWESVGNKRTLASTLGLITRIPGEVLKGDISTTEVCGAQIMSWAADRKTTRVEDRAYSLLGLFGVNMPMLYGEGRKAFQRLQLEILRVSNDHSIFAWDLQGKIRRFGSVLADDPSYFRDCHDVRILKPDQFIKHLKEDLRGNLGPAHFLPAQLGKFAQLTLRGHACADKLRKLSVTNRGVEMCLPLTPYHVSPPVYRAVLACTQSHANLLVTIDLVHHESSYYRCIGATGGRLPQAIPAFRQLYLAYRQDQTCCNVTLYEGVISYHGFTRCGAFPLDITGNSIALSSLANSLTVLVYANDKAKARFAVGLGYHHIHQQWVHVVCDEPGDGWSPWADYAKRAYERLRNAYTGITGDSKERYKPGYYVNHAHLPRSIWAAKVVWGQSRVGNATVTVDVDQCTGCCYGPLEWRVTADDRDGLPIPGLMKMDIAYKRGHWLLVDGIHIKLLECTTQMIALGDYGDWDRKDETFKCNGNIFEELRTLSGVLAVKPNDPACRPVKRIVSSAVKRDDGVETVVDPKTFPPLVLRGPVGWLLPNSRHLILLLKALSARLTDKYLVTAVVQCSAYRAFGSSSEWVEKAGSGVNEHSKDREFLCAL
ncbi:hypothetical protein F5J12DRAFT_164229 [Pisolithus orientalis]|uniref:uncharacterized protein n=1 Tax=Pisolithus orientalis TaxID=936130 RepID=UPI00222558C0|nr:uncharacterized protein F5J12DRAFT_164229 [Pisolithus orientalis]KAI6003185.1 hypothetical protein F5J12DRAFT_164229 [Pisolithus orientalis]